MYKLFLFLTFLYTSKCFSQLEFVGPYGLEISKLFKTDSIVYAQTGGPDLFFKGNNELKWNRIEGIGSINSIINFNNFLLACSDDGIIKSTNNGINWSKTNLKINTTSIAKINQIIIAGTKSDGIFISNDGGINWLSKSNGLTSLEVTSIGVISNIIIVGTKNGLFKSTNYGNTWEFLLNDEEVYQIEVAPPNYFYLVSRSKFFPLQVSRYNIISNMWEPFNNPISPQFRAIKKIESNQDGVIFLFEEDFFTGEFCFKSSDFGVTWETIFQSSYTSNKPAYYEDINDLVVLGNSVYLGTNYGINLSDISGNLWRHLNNGLDLSSRGSFISSILSDAKKIYSSGQTITYSEDTAKSWNLFIDFYDQDLKLFEREFYNLAIHKNYIFSRTNYGELLRIDKENFNYEYIDPYGANAILSDGTNLYAGSSEGFFVSSNDGETWLQYNNGLTNRQITRLAKNGNNLYAGTNDGIFYTNNLGNFWKKSISGIPNNTSIYTIFVGTNYILVGSSTGVYKSIDNAVSWNKVDLTFTVSSFEQYNSAIVAGTIEDFLYISYDKGETWTSLFKQPFPQEHSVYSLKIINDYLYIGEEGSIERVKLTSIPTQTNNLKKSYKSLHWVEPNPIYDVGNLKIDNSILSNIERISIYNMYGKLLKEFSVKEAENIVINKNEFSSGIYFYSISCFNRPNLSGYYVIN